MKEIKLFTRREIVKAGLGIVAGGFFAPAFLSRTIWAIEQSRSPVRNPSADVADRILVVIQLGGGNDGLNTIVPFRMEPYYQKRPTLAIPRSTALPLTDSFALHQEMKEFKELYDQGVLSIIQGVGYPNPNRSHFRSMDIWHTARPDSKSESTGWLGRYFDNACPGCAPPVGAINFGPQIPLALQGEQDRVIAIIDPERTGWQASKKAANSIQYEMQVLNQLLQSHSISSDALFIAHTQMNSLISGEKLKNALSRGKSSAAYPDTNFGNQLQVTAQLISGALPTRIYYLHLGGFDTHANQAGRHSELLKEYSDGMLALYQDLKATGDLDRVLVLTFTEFGRRLEENASGGTDHGTANPLFLMGTKVRSGFFGEHPSLQADALDPIGDPIHKIDFRSVYATILEKWLGADSESVLAGKFPVLPVIS